MDNLLKIKGERNMLKKIFIIVLTALIYFFLYFGILRNLFSQYIENILLQSLIMGIIGGLLVFIDLRLFRKIAKNKK